MDASKPQIRGKDLVGGVMVMPMGLDAAIKKRTSGEFKMEQNDGSMSFSNTSQQSSSSMKKETRQLASFQEESSGSSFNQQQSFQSMQSSMQSSQSMTQSSTFQSSAQQQSSSSMSMSSSKTMSSKTSSQSMTSSSLTTGFTQENQLKDVTQEWESKLGIQNTEIKQDNLKTQIVSAITDLEGDRDLADFGKENKTIDLMSPPQAKSPTPKNPTFTPTKQDPFSPPKNDVFSPPPLERFEPPQQQQQQQLQQQPQQLPELPLSNGSSHPQPVPTRNGVNGLQNGFNEFVSTSKNMEMQQIEEFSQSTRINGKFEECGSIQESNSSNSLLQKIMTPAPVEYDTNSLKKKDPKKMFTDSSFYNSKYHPTIADQVEMAHKLSSAMFNEQNKGTKGAKMYLTRMENSGGFGDDIPKHDNVPNMKLVMNPEGKVHLWDDLPADQRPDYQQIAVHAAPNLDIPEVKDPVAESLNAGIGKGGELFTKRKQKAESWIVDDSTIGRMQPSAVADKFINEQTQQQQAIQQQKLFEQQQKQQIQQQEIAVREAELLQQQQEAKQAFVQTQQFKQEQSMEVRRIQEMAQQQIDFPQDFKHANLKQRSYTPSLDLGCHNVQGINVWANTAPRGWGSAGNQRSLATPSRNSNVLPPSTPSADNEMAMRMEETRLREEEERIRLEQEKQILLQEEQMRLKQEEEMRMQQELLLQQQREEQMRMEEMMRQEEERKMHEQRQREQEEMIRRQEEERLRQEEMMRQEEERRQQEEIKRQEEEFRRHEEEMRQQEEMRRQQEEMRRQEQMRIQAQEEERMRQEMERKRQEEEMARQAEIARQEEERQMQMRIQQEEQQRQLQQQQYIEQQQMMQQQQMQEQQQMQQQQQFSQQQSFQTTQEQKISSITKTGVDDLDLEAQKRREYEEWFRLQEKEALEYSACVKYQEKEKAEERTQTLIDVTDFSTSQQITSNIQSCTEQSNSGFSYGAIPTKEPKALPPMSSSSMSFESSQSQSQQFSSVQTSSFAQEQSRQEVYESQEFNGGVMKGYRRKDELSNEFSSEQNNRDSGIFGGINGDCNQLVNEEFDYKKHSVKDLAKHFALVKPKKNIPQNILPEQRMFNGDHAPQLNYLGAGAENGQVVQGQQQSRREVSQQDIEASKAAYEMKKKQQMEAQQQTQTSSSTSSSTVVRRTETSSSEQKTERRMSLRDSLMLDPAKAHADAGLIDPSAILRGSDITGRRSTSESLNQSVPGETDKVMNKWDNHNTIARGWAGVKANYHPVTFRNIYNVDSQNQTSSIQL